MSSTCVWTVESYILTCIPRIHFDWLLVPVNGKRKWRHVACPDTCQWMKIMCVCVCVCHSNMYESERSIWEMNARVCGWAREGKMSVLTCICIGAWTCDVDMCSCFERTPYHGTDLCSLNLHAQHKRSLGHCDLVSLWSVTVCWSHQTRLVEYFLCAAPLQGWCPSIHDT